jgi:hypothetical protein
VTAASSVVQTEFCGFPFIDPDFNSNRLLTAAACIRWTRENGAGAAPTRVQLNEVLTPERAWKIRRLDLELDMSCEDLPAARLAQAMLTVEQIGQLLPAWQPLLALPIRFVQLRDSQAVSASTFAWPQWIFLSEVAFASPATLAEQVLHELSHQWLYLIEEMWPLQQPGTHRVFTLPSGTPDRSASEVLGAVHVVINLHTLWSLLPVSEEDRRRRIEHLRRYGTGCLPLLSEAETVLTPDGRALTYRLREEVATL